MLFTTVEFVLLLVAAFGAYWAMGPSKQRQNLVLLLASLVFYGWADLRFLGLLAASAATNYLVGLGLAGEWNERRKSLLFWFGIGLNLGLLIFFKYFDFFYAGVVDLLSILGAEMSYDPLRLILPLGISFFTFQSIGYLIDVRNDDMEPCRDPLAFFNWVFFFPKMLAGPIERAQRFLPQVAQARRFNRDRALEGCRQILWGLFAKVVIAERCARMVNPSFAHHDELSGTTLLASAIFYFFELYADFSGYSNIALGVSLLLGIELGRNFATPLFATSIADFWRRWHISLSSWMMDYLYTPLSFILRHKGQWGAALAIFITFLTVGIWHGANWTFVLFGVIQGSLFLPLVLKRKDPRRIASDDPAKDVGAFVRMILLFLVLGLAFVLLRAADLEQAFSIWSRIFSASLFDGLDNNLRELRSTAFLLCFFFLMEWLGRKDHFAIQRLGLGWPRLLRWSFYWALGMAVILLAQRMSGFIYFQF